MENSEISTSSGEKPTSNPFSRALKVFLRLFVAIVVGLAIGLGLYFGGVTLYRIAVGPGPSYDQQVEDYQEEVAQLRFDLAERDLEIDEQQSGLERLINEGADLSASQSEAISEQMTVLAAELTVLTDLKVSPVLMATKVIQVQRVLPDLPLLRVIPVPKVSPVLMAPMALMGPRVSRVLMDPKVSQAKKEHQVIRKDLLLRLM